MLRGRFESAGEMSAEELQEAYEDLLVEAIEEAGVETVADQSGIDREKLEALVDGESPDVTLEEAAAILGADEELPDTETIEAEARDILLMGMSIAVLDVEAIAAGINDELEPKEIQQKAEGRFPMTLEEYAILHSYIESKKR